jgi:hypothetical protein
MDARTIDQEYEKLQAEFQDVAVTVQGLAEKMQAAAKAGDANAGAWLADLKRITEDIHDEQTQAHVLLQTIHGFLTNLAKAQGEEAPEKPPLFAPGHEPQPAQQQPAYPQAGGLLGGAGPLGGGLLGGPMLGGYFGGNFARSMEMGVGISLVQSLLGGLFRL